MCILYLFIPKKKKQTESNGKHGAEEIRKMILLFMERTQFSTALKNKRLLSSKFRNGFYVLAMIYLFMMISYTIILSVYWSGIFMCTLFTRILFLAIKTAMSISIIITSIDVYRIFGTCSYYKAHRHFFVYKPLWAWWLFIHLEFYVFGMPMHLWDVLFVYYNHEVLSIVGVILVITMGLLYSTLFVMEVHIVFNLSLINPMKKQMYASQRKYTNKMISNNNNNNRDGLMRFNVNNNNNNPNVNYSRTRNPSSVNYNNNNNNNNNQRNKLPNQNNQKSIVLSNMHLNRQYQPMYNA